MLIIDSHLILNQKCHFVVIVCLWKVCPIIVLLNRLTVFLIYATFFVWPSWQHIRSKLQSVTSVPLSLTTAALALFSTPSLPFFPTLFYCTSLLLFHNLSHSCIQMWLKIYIYIYIVFFFVAKCYLLNISRQCKMNTWIVGEKKKKKLKWRLSGGVSQRHEAEQMGGMRLYADCIMAPQSWGGNVKINMICPPLIFKRIKAHVQ